MKMSTKNVQMFSKQVWKGSKVWSTIRAVSSVGEESLSHQKQMEKQRELLLFMPAFLMLL